MFLVQFTNINYEFNEPGVWKLKMYSNFNALRHIFGKYFFGIFVRKGNPPTGTSRSLRSRKHSGLFQDHFILLRPLRLADGEEDQVLLTDVLDPLHRPRRDEGGLARTEHGISFADMHPTLPCKDVVHLGLVVKPVRDGPLPP